MKRLFDVGFAALALVVLAPVLLAVVILVALRLGRPVLFRQRRAGRGGRPFTILKFRTMTNETGPDGQLLPDAERLPPFGAFLRSTSLDELPELLNVLRGEMSIVGPRPLLLRYNDRYSERQARRLHVRPGITGWAQIHGRNALSWQERFELDGWYVENQSLWLDVRIILRTFAKVWARDGISASGEATMSEFLGNPAGDASAQPRSPSPSETE